MRDAIDDDEWMTALGKVVSVVMEVQKLAQSLNHRQESLIAELTARVKVLERKKGGQNESKDDCNQR